MLNYIHKLIWRIIILNLYIQASYSYPEQGKWEFPILEHNDGKGEAIVVSKSQYKGSKYTVSVVCSPITSSEEFSLTITWYLRKAACWKEFSETSQVNYSPEFIFVQLERKGKSLANETSFYLKSSEVIPCDGQNYYLSSVNIMMKSQSEIDAEERQKYVKSLMQKEEAAFSNSIPITQSPSVNEKINSSMIPGEKDSSIQPFYIVPYDGIYQLVLGSNVDGKTMGGRNVSYSLAVSIKIKNDYGYLSAADYPLLVFFSTMCVIYVIFAIGWLAVSFLRWRELLRVQYWIGAVIFLGMIEKAVFTAEYEGVNRNGTSVPGLIVFAELVSCAKRTLSRMLVIIVSFGFGIVKPRLGVVLNRVVIIGVLYFFLASFEGCFRVLMSKDADEEHTRRLMFAVIPLALLESGICWWVFSALWSTTRTLQLRRNTIKLNLFRHFTHTLLFAVVSSIIFMLWSIRHLKYDICLSDWKQLWVNDAFWHVLFAIILLAIIILWRPTNNNQRFAFSPLLDEGSEGDEEEEEEKLMADVSDTMKLRGSSSRRNSIGSSSPRNSRSFEDDLRWAEENIPSAATDTGMPIVDSEEEILMTKFEISKMQ